MTIDSTTDLLLYGDTHTSVKSPSSSTLDFIRQFSRTYNYYTELSSGSIIIN